MSKTRITEMEELPEEWEFVRMGDIALDFISGGTPSTKNPKYWNGDIPWMTSAHINGRTIASGIKNITEKGLKNSASNIVPKNSILLATRVGIGKAAINLIDIAISQDLTGIVPNREKIDENFIYWFITSNPNKLKALAQGSTIKGLLRSGIERLKIPLPPLPEQQKIAEVLSTVDNAIQKVDDAIAKTERLKKGLMQRLLNNKRWPIKTVREVLEIESGIKELQARDYLDRGEFPVIDQGQEFIAGYSNDKSKLFDRKIPVIVYGDHTKIIKYIDFPFVIGASGAKILSTINVKENDTKFLYYALQSVRVPEKSGGYARHSRELLLQKFRIPTSVQEQQKISSILSTVDKKLDLEHQRKAKLERIKKGLMNDLLTGGRRVKAGVVGGV